MTTAAELAATVREALVRLEGDIRDLDPSVHGDDLAAATQMALDDVNSILAALDALEAQAEGNVTIAQAAEASADTQYKRAEAAAAELAALHESRALDIVLYTQAAEADNTRLRDALQQIVDTKESGFGSSGWGTDFYEIARAALATERIDPVDGLTDDERAHRRDNALNYGEIERLRKVLKAAQAASASWQLYKAQMEAEGAEYDTAPGSAPVLMDELAHALAALATDRTETQP